MYSNRPKNNKTVEICMEMFLSHNYPRPVGYTEENGLIPATSKTNMSFSARNYLCFRPGLCRNKVLHRHVRIAFSFN